MKKTLIALAVAASAAVSGSAMAAWTTNGTGGTVAMGGTLTPVAKVTPWAVQVGAAVTGLDADIQTGQRTVDVIVNKAIPVLGIRTQLTTPFTGRSGITPQIDYLGKVDLDGFSKSSTTLTLDVNDAQGAKIGSLSVPFLSAAEFTYRKLNDANEKHRGVMIAKQAGDAFWGGLPKTESKASSDVRNLINSIDNTIAQNYSDLGLQSYSHTINDTLSNPGYEYSAYYGGGIQQGKIMKITLDSPAPANTSIAWKASLPVIVTYQ